MRQWWKVFASNIPMQQDIVRDAVFAKGGMNIHYLEKKLGLK